MVSSFEIVGKIREYLGGQLSLESFRAWIVDAHLEADNCKEGEGDQDAGRLLADIEGRYAEFSDELVSEEIWKRRLAGLITPSPQSAESYLLTYFYSIPSAFLSNSGSVMVQPQTGNLNGASNYRPVPEPERSVV
jgi:hypothetical protein